MSDGKIFLYLVKMSKTIRDFSESCRLCLLQEGEMHIFNRDEKDITETVTLQHKILYCVSVEVLEGDELPSRICFKCSCLIDKFYEFKGLCENNDLTLRGYLTKCLSETSNLQIQDVKEENSVCPVRPEILPENISQRNSSEVDSHNEVEDDNAHLFCDVNIIENGNVDSAEEGGGCREGSDSDESKCKEEIKNTPEKINKVSKEKVLNQPVTNESKNDGDNPKFSCEVCLKTFSKRTYLRQHKIAHNGTRPHICLECNSKFIRSGDLTRHIKIHDRGKIIRDKQPVNILKKIAPIKETLFSCKVCSKTFTKLVYLRRHVIIHSDRRPYECKVCKNTFTRSGDLSKHMRIHTRELTKLEKEDTAIHEYAGEFVCKLCSRSFSKEFYLKQHTVVHIEKEPTTYLCDECGKAFKQRGALTQHKATHSTVKSHICSDCGKAFAFIGRLRDHLKVHAGVKPYLCNICGKAFAAREGLFAHERTHTGEKPYCCNLCPRTFATSSNYRTHMRHHTEGKRFPCTHCPTAFFTKSGLERHERLHSGVKPFACDICSVCFYTKRELIRHKLFHLGNKRFSCDRCNKSYYERQHLVIHQRTHTGERPYVCNWCSKSFYECSKLKRHAQTHVRDKV